MPGPLGTSGGTDLEGSSAGCSSSSLSPSPDPVGGVFRYGSRWESSVLCRLSGSLFVFASQTSLFLLTVAVLERYLTSNSRHRDPRHEARHDTRHEARHDTCHDTHHEARHDTRRDTCRENKGKNLIINFFSHQTLNILAFEDYQPDT